MGNDKKQEVEIVRCSKCGVSEKYPIGYLTEIGKTKYLCSICREEVLENRVEKSRMSGKKLLTEEH